MEKERFGVLDGWRGIKETWPAVLVGGGSFALVQFLTANYIGPELPDITSALVSLVVLTLFGPPAGRRYARLCALSTGGVLLAMVLAMGRLDDRQLEIQQRLTKMRENVMRKLEVVDVVRLRGRDDG